MMFPSWTQRACFTHIGLSETASAPDQDILLLVALLPSSKPAFARSQDPVQTDSRYFNFFSELV